MDKIHYGSWSSWIGPVGVLLRLLALIAAQPGFISIDCGGKTNYTTENNIAWVTDSNYIDVGETAGIGDATQQAYGSYLQSLRFFAKPLNKSCYHLPVSPNVPYLLRLSFALGNYTGFRQLPINFAFSIETLGTLAVQNISITNIANIPPFYYEEVLVSSGKVLYICLIRTTDTDDPFINAIELRTLRDGMYPQAKPGRMLSLDSRYDVGGNWMVRYPQDNFDRTWTSDLSLTIQTPYIGMYVSSKEPISTNNTKDVPPTAVMQTAWVLNSSDSLTVRFGSTKVNEVLLLLYFAEIETLNMSESRSFNITINGQVAYEVITLPQNYSALEVSLLLNPTNSLNLALMKAANSTLGPIINAIEYYAVYDTQPATYSQDIEAIVAIKNMFNMKEWISDPCFLIEWKGIGCNKSSSAIRISELNLSGRNQSGSVPEHIAQLTALVSLSLDNNHLTGPLPNFSGLKMLERLYLQNNNLSGSVPDWLSELQNLKELFLNNNNFSGIIPVQLQRPSLKLKYSGNPYLQIPPNSKKKKLRVLLGMTLSGILIIALSLIGGIALYCKKKKSTTESNGLEMEPKNHVDLPSKELIDSTIILPNRAKSCSFTQDEMMAATQKFSGIIGKGGFGSVFFGKLPEGKDVAVKVLSLFSKQGVDEFLNEINVLSRVHHKNLVSLLGYCNESRELMLIYEHMSGGSLWDRLYGGSELNWRSRIKIALDAARGLEYMHVVCTPRIVHRDVKTANILLDSNLNGKLGDFGLSRVWINGEVSHVTTMVKGTAGYLDPEYFSTEKLTEKSDVYSFGVVLLEIICGRQPIDAKVSVDKRNLTRWATPFIEMDAIPGTIEEIIDERLGGNYNLESITRVAKVAIRCVKDEPSKRPSVSEVVAELIEAIKLEDNASLSVSEQIGIECEDLQGRPVCVLDTGLDGERERSQIEKSSR